MHIREVLKPSPLMQWFTLSFGIPGKCMELGAWAKVSVKPDGGVGRWNVVLLFCGCVCVCVCERNLLSRYVRTYCVCERETCCVDMYVHAVLG